MSRAPRTSIAALALAAVCLFSASRAAAEPLRDIFVAANRAYFAGDYARAAVGYEELVAAGISDPDVFYNLGVARARAGEHGAAMVAFEKALALRPGDDDAEDALAKVEDAVARGRAEREGEATTDSARGLLAALGALLPEHVLAILVLVLNALAFGALAGLLGSKREAVRVALGVTAPVAFALLVLSGLALLGRTEALDEGKAAIVVDDHVALREGPDPNAPTGGELREGDRVRVLSRHDAYYEVLTRDGSRGWVDRRAAAGLDVFAPEP